jgi:hypothetical protein
MSDGNEGAPNQEPTIDQTPPGTPWSDPGRVTDSYDGPSPVADNE